jgi:hypothetical protein
MQFGCITLVLITLILYLLLFLGTIGLTSNLILTFLHTLFLLQNCATLSPTLLNYTKFCLTLRLGYRDFGLYHFT